MNDYRLQSQYMQQPSKPQTVPEARGIGGLSYLIWLVNDFNNSLKKGVISY